MPLPTGTRWDEAWGGSLELYPVNEDGEPQTVPSKKISPSWNQFIFFEVQPGRSFHSVEEVIVGGANDSRDRLSISGWFHKAQEDEEGYQPESTTRDKSSLEQLVSDLKNPICISVDGYRSQQALNVHSLHTHQTRSYHCLLSR